MQQYKENGYITAADLSTTFSKELDIAYYRNLPFVIRENSGSRIPANGTNHDASNRKFPITVCEHGEIFNPKITAHENWLADPMTNPYKLEENTGIENRNISAVVKSVFFVLHL